MASTTLPKLPIPLQKQLSAHFSIMRLDHSVKQIFVLPGVVVALMLEKTPLTFLLFGRILLGFVAFTATASSNYVLNEMLDAPFDRTHPTKRLRPAACGAIQYGVGYLQWMTLAALGFWCASLVHKELVLCCFALWFMGIVYNVKPLRTKDIAYLDVLSESINNPIRFCAGWSMITTTLLPPASLLLAYWMLGSYLMALKRFSEFRQIGEECARLYRRSFQHYSSLSLLNSIVFYAATAMLFLGAFIMRYKLELILAFPFIALLMAVYFNLAFEPDSAVQNPEKLFREPKLMVLLSSCVALLWLLLFAHIPSLYQLCQVSSR